MSHVKGNSFTRAFALLFLVNEITDSLVLLGVKILCGIPLLDASSLLFVMTALGILAIPKFFAPFQRAFCNPILMAALVWSTLVWSVDITIAGLSMTWSIEDKVWWPLLIISEVVSFLVMWRMTRYILRQFPLESGTLDRNGYLKGAGYLGTVGRLLLYSLAPWPHGNHGV